jgi:hypothetical protein
MDGMNSRTLAKEEEELLRACGIAFTEGVG